MLGKWLKLFLEIPHIEKIAQISKARTDPDTGSVEPGSRLIFGSVSG